MTPWEARIQGVLLGNAAFSMSSAIVFIFARDPIAVLIHSAFPPLIILIVGLGLAVFAAGLIATGLSRRLDRSKVWQIIVSDLLWVVGTIIGLTIYGNVITPSGFWIAVMIALAVSGFGALQFLGLKLAAKEG